MAVVLAATHGRQRQTHKKHYFKQLDQHLPGAMAAVSASTPATKTITQETLLEAAGPMAAVFKATPRKI